MKTKSLHERLLQKKILHTTPLAIAIGNNNQNKTISEQNKKEQNKHKTKQAGKIKISRITSTLFRETLF